MSEEPEIHLNVDFLEDTLVGKQISSLIFCDGPYISNKPEGYDNFDSLLPLLLKEVDYKGTFIYFIFEDTKGNEYFCLNYIFSGKWQLDYDEYCKWFIETSDNETIWFSDIKSLSTIRFVFNQSILDNELSLIGPDILKPEFKLPLFKEILSKNDSMNICLFLSNIYLISGISNYIKVEVLYDCKISPHRKINELTENEKELLYQSLYITSRLFYNNCINNKIMTNYLKIYGKKTAKRIKTSDGHITYWDPNIQI